MSGPIRDPYERGNKNRPDAGSSGPAGPGGLAMGDAHVGEVSGHGGCPDGVGANRGRAVIDISYEALSRLPTIQELGVNPEILEACEALCASAEAPGVERETLESLVRLILSNPLKARAS